MGRGQGAELLFGSRTRSAGEKAAARRHQVGEEIRQSFTRGWGLTAELLVENRTEVLSDAGWAQGLLREVASSLPRGTADVDSRLDPDRVAEELAELLSRPDLDVGLFSRCSLGVPDSLLALDAIRPAGAAPHLVETLGRHDCVGAGEVLVRAEPRGFAFQKASEAFAATLIDERLDDLEPQAGFLLRAVNGLDLRVWRSGRKGSLLHLTAAGEEATETSYCDKKLPVSFYPADRGELRMALEGSHPEGIKPCARCLRRAQRDNHPSLDLEGSSIDAPKDLRDRVRRRALAPVVAAIAAANDPEDLDEEGLEDSLETQVRAGIREPAVEALLELDEEERWRRLMGYLIHRDAEISDCEEWPSFPDATADQVLEYIAFCSDTHTNRAKARAKAADVFKVRAGIRDLEAEKREAEKKRRSWKRWDRGRNHTDLALGKELHLFVDQGGEVVFQGAVLPRAICGSGESYDPAHRGNRFGYSKCTKCEELESEFDARVAQES